MSLNYTEKTYYPVLFGYDAKGKERMWKIWVEGDTIHRLSGLVYGKKVPSSRKIKGKNLKTKVATTAEEQAILEAERAWTKQLDKNYRPAFDDEEGNRMYDDVMEEKEKTGGQNVNASSAMNNRKKKNIQKVNNLVVDLERNIIPMKANKWELLDDKNPYSPLPKVLNHFNFDKGVYVQWKLDGYRCISRKQSDGSISMTTNTSKQYPWFSRLRKAVDLFWDDDLCLDGLDGELYCHSLFDDEAGIEVNEEKRFALIQGICALSNKSPHRLEDQMQLYIFDLVDLSGKINQDERFKCLKKLFSSKRLKRIFGDVDVPLVLTETKVVNYVEEVPQILTDFCQAGYEGVILRDRQLKYEPKRRSLKMRKFKFFIDKEYRITGIYSDPGVGEEYFSWKCETEDGKEFKATPKGTREEKIELHRNYLNYLGMYLTVTFQEYSDNGIPRFPIAKAIRDPSDF